MTTVYVAGSLNVDQCVRVTDLPRAGETVVGSHLVRTVGGKGGNQAVAAARAGASVVMLGAVGDDTDGARVLKALVESGVDVTHVRFAPQPTGLAIITVDARGENSIVLSSGANADLREADIDHGLAEMASGDVLLLQLESPESVVRHAADVAQRHGAKVVLNAAPAPTAIDGLFDDVDVLIVNEHEARSIGGAAGISGDDGASLVADLAAAFALTVVCTAGARGAYANVDQGVVHVAGIAVQAVDTTGAGDTFVGYLAAQLAEQPGGLLAALDQATRAAALTVTRRGSMTAIPTVQDVQQALGPNYVSLGGIR
jgi:ribokinase